MKTSEIIINAFFGNKCIKCGKMFEINCPKNICDECRTELLGQLKNAPISINNKYITSDKFLFSYNYTEARELVLKMKSEPKIKICRFFAEEAARCIKEDVNFPEFDIITHCPRKPSKKRIIGYDHSQQFASCLAEKLGVPYKELLGRTEGGKEQKTIKNYFERMRNVHGKFFVQHPEDIRRKRILLVDDIVTTASTATECAKTLKESGASKIFALFILD